MDALRRNLISIISGVVALLSIVLVFFPINGWFDGLQSAADRSKSEYTRMTSLANQRITIPFSNETVAIIPSEQMIAELKERADRLEKLSADLVQHGAQRNQRKLLVADSLPAAENVYGILFSKRYREYFDELAARLNATRLPTQAEVAAARQKQEEAFISSRVQTLPGGATNIARLQAEFQRDHAPLVWQQLCRDRASRYTMYVATPTSAVQQLGFHRHAGIPEPGTAPAPVDLWFAQHSLWIQEDIVDAIVKTNSQYGRKNDSGQVVVEGAAVKNLVQVSVTPGYVTGLGLQMMPVQAGGARPFGGPEVYGGPLGGPMLGPTGGPLGGPAQKAPTKNYTTSVTGHVSNPVYDVMQFSVTVDMDGRYLNAFMDNLTGERFITIINAEVRSVDREVEQYNGYFYGESPVVRVKLDCEAAFFREWTERLMPDEIKRMLMITPPRPAAGRGF